MQKITRVFFSEPRISIVFLFLDQPRVWITSLVKNQESLDYSTLSCPP
jgi:hypothetical protein